MKAYSLLKLLNAYSENKDFIHAYLKKQPIEGYKDDTDTVTVNNSAILGMTVEIFLIILIISISIWVFALVLLINNWNVLPDWAKVVGVIGVLPIFPFGSIVTIISVLASKSSR